MCCDRHRNRAISRKVVAARKAREIEEREALAREDEEGIRSIGSPLGGSEKGREIKSETVEVSVGLAVGKKGTRLKQDVLQRPVFLSLWVAPYPGYTGKLR